MIPIRTIATSNSIRVNAEALFRTVTSFWRLIWISLARMWIRASRLRGLGAVAMISLGVFLPA